MSENIAIEHIRFNPDNLLDILIERFQLKNDAGLARWLEVTPPTISKIRHRRSTVGARLLIRMHETTDISIRELRELMDDRRTNYQECDVFGKLVATAERAG